jgi:hypothetical protein
MISDLLYHHCKDEIFEVEKANIPEIIYLVPIGAQIGT